MNITKGDRVRVDTAAYSTLPNPMMGTIERATWLAQTEMYGLTIVMDSGRRFRLWVYFDEITVLSSGGDTSETDRETELARAIADRDRLQAEVARLQSEVQRLWAHSFDAAELLDSIRRIVEGGEDA